MEKIELKEKYESLNEEQRKSFILKTCLEADDLKKTVGIIIEFEKDFYKKYIKEVYVSIFSKVYKEKTQETENYFQDSEYYYNNILNKFKVLSKELKLANSLELSTLYTYLLWNGYFSKDKKFNYEIENRALIEGRFSYDIMNGNGVCLNFSDMLKDILNNCGYKSSTLLNRPINTKELKNNYVIDIERNAKNPKPLTKVLPIILQPLVKRMGNHAFNLIEENSKLYIYDATNLILLELNDKYIASLLVGKGEFSLKPYLSIAFNDEKSRKLLYLLNETKEFSTPYTRKDYIITSENSMELFNSNKSLLDDYHEDINNDIVNIANSVDYYKKNKRKILRNEK